MKNKKKESEYEGIFRLANKSFGFVKIDVNDLEEEIYVSTKDSLDAMNDDKVIVKILSSNVGVDKKRVGKIIKVLEHSSDIVVGIFEPNKGFGFVRPINSKIPFDIHVEKKYYNKAVKDSIVEVKILPKKNKKDNPEGIIINVIGHKDDPNAEITAIVHDFKIRDEFSDKAKIEAEKMPSEISKDEYRGRIDLRNKLFVTIDGDDTKDIDDAVCLEKKGKNSVLYVSIADVSYYVKEGSALDKEALKRGNSVYLLDRVIPMLPHILSNGICSLNENEDRLTLTCEMEFDKSGKIIRHNIYKSIICSHKRMTYNQVQDIIDDETSYNDNISSMIKDMIVLSRIIRKKREERGAINFDLKETSIIVDDNLKPIDIYEKERIEAYKLIEDFMVSANETVAEEYYFREVPFLYRTHEVGDEEKLANLKATLESLLINFNIKKNVHPKDIQKLLNIVKGTDKQYVIEKLTLRSMSQAKYTKNLIGHFALASKYYTHFTSPIRRYSDLQIHRIINEVLDNILNEYRISHYESILDNVALHISKTERLAIDCERDIEALKKCEYMLPHVGECFEGNISGLTNFGIFVELPNTIEGMIPLRDIRDDHYIFDESKYRIIGENKKREFNFGDHLKVVLSKCTIETRTIDFVLDE